jgi:DNA-binding NtrC family response regulator
MTSSSEAFTPGSSSDPGVAGTSLRNCPGARLLIVDDELAHRNVLAVMVKQAGIACKTASSAAEALSYLRTERIDAVIADLNMPKVSGMELLVEIRLRYPHMVFVMATGTDDVRLGVQAMRQGADDYLTKPLNIDIVMMSLDRAFHKKCLEQELDNYRQNLEQMVCKRTVELQDALGQVEQGYADTLDALGGGR